MQLSRQALAQIDSSRVQVPEQAYFDLPEKVLQFGTGVLLRGLPDYFIDQANKRGVFNGRIVVVKSTQTGDVSAFAVQDYLYTHCIRGLDQGRLIQEQCINASISRILSAQTDWDHILACAANPELVLVISNTTEVGIRLVPDDIRASPPASFPGKLLAFLYRRFHLFQGDPAKGMVIIPTELLPDNGKLLHTILVDMARAHRLEDAFVQWLQHCNTCCSSLVDRIVPGKLTPAMQEQTSLDLGYRDELMMMSEVYRLWAIETSSQQVKALLSFSQVDKGVVLADDISQFRELKLRLLNGPHTLSCGLAYLAGFDTVKQAMADPAFFHYIEHLMLLEIVPVLTSPLIGAELATRFAREVLDRFRNPFLEHAWLNISLQYSFKMRMRNVPLLLQYARKFQGNPAYLCWGFAAYLLFMKCEQSGGGQYAGRAWGRQYSIQDDQAQRFCSMWAKSANTAVLVQQVLSCEDLWGTNLALLPGLADSIQQKLDALMADGPKAVIRDLLQQAGAMDIHQ